MAGRSLRIGQVDMSTGEILEGAQLAIVYPKRKNGFTSGWVAMAQESMLQLAQSNIGNEGWKVFSYLVGTLDYENWINLNQTAAAAAVGMKQPNFARALRKLLDLGVILPGPKIGRFVTYRLNPSYGWKGSARAHNDALSERMKARGLSVVNGSGLAAPPESENQLELDV